MKLHITNGDSAGGMIKEAASLEGEVLCWRDVLHDGPIIAEEGDELYRARAAFLWSVMDAKSPLPKFRGTEETILQGYVERQALLHNLDKYDEIILWFEHDLYDQLQLAECLYHLAKVRNICEKTSIICIGEHDGVPYFHGLGNLAIPQLEALFPNRQPLTPDHLREGKRVWHALASSNTEALEKLILEQFSALSFMQDALKRFAREYPWTGSGLTLTQQYVLQSIISPLEELPILLSNLKMHEQAGRLEPGVNAERRYEEIMSSKDIRFGRLFINMQTLEEAPFLGDSWLMKEISTLSSATVPYIKCHHADGNTWDLNTVYSATEAGMDALKGKLRWGVDNQYDLWRGGVHITHQQLVLWDDVQGRFEMRENART